MHKRYAFVILVPVSHPPAVTSLVAAVAWPWSPATLMQNRNSDSASPRVCPLEQGGGE